MSEQEKMIVNEFVNKAKNLDSLSMKVMMPQMDALLLRQEIEEEMIEDATSDDEERG